MPERAFISIPLDIPEVRVLRTEINKDNEFVLTVESTRKSATCRICGRTITERHGNDAERTLRHLPILGRPVFLRIRPKRFRCTSCDGQPTTTQQLDWYDPNGLHAKAFEQHLIVGLVNSTIADLVAKEDVSYDALEGILDRWVAKTVDWQAIEAFSTLGIDEIALTKGHRNFVAVLSAATDSGHLQLLAILPDRLKTTLVAWLKSLPSTNRRYTCPTGDRQQGYAAPTTPYPRRPCRFASAAGVTLEAMAQACDLHGWRARESASAWELGHSTPRPIHRTHFISYLLDTLGLRTDPARFDAIWACCVKSGAGRRSAVPSATAFLGFTAHQPLASSRDRNAFVVLNHHGVLGLPHLLPPGSRVPWGRNPFFTGRDDDLAALHRALLPDGEVLLGTPAVAVTGAGGMGKTQLAVEFVHRVGGTSPAASFG
jgi:hypothetical protein